MDTDLIKDLEVSDRVESVKSNVELNELRGEIELAIEAYETHPVVREVKIRRNNRVERIQESQASLVVDTIAPITPRGYVDHAGNDNLDRLYRKLKRDLAGDAVDLQDDSFYMKASDGGIYTDRNSIMAEWLSIVKNRVSDEALLNLEIEQSTVGSRSLKYPFELLSDRAASTFEEKSNVKVPEKYLDMADETFRKLLPYRSLVPFSISDVASLDAEEDKMKGDTASGYPYFSSGWMPAKGADDKKVQLLSQVHEAILKECSTNMAELRTGKAVPFYAIVYFRGHIVDQTKDEEKKKSTRLVWAAPKWETILWKTILTPLQDHLKKVSINGIKPFVAMGYQYETAIEVQRLLGKGEVISGDISQFDLSKSQDYSLRICNLIADCFRHQEVRKMVSTLGESSYTRGGAITATKVYQPGFVSQFSGSGTTLTHNSMTVVHVLITGHHMGAWRLKGTLNIGDDFASRLEGATPQIVQEVFEMFGFKASADEQKCSSDWVHFLQLLHVRGRVGGIYPTSRALAHIMAPERRIAAEGLQRNYVSLCRWMSLIHNCEFNPLIRDLVEFLRAYHRYGMYPDLSLEEVLAGAGTEGLQALIEDQVHKGPIGKVPMGLWVSDKLRRRQETGPTRFIDVYGVPEDSISRSAKNIEL